MSVYELERDGDVEELARLLRESDSDSVRRHVAEALGDIDDAGRDAVDALIEAAAEDPDSGVRTAAVDALDQQGPGPVERLLVELAEVDLGDGNRATRITAFAESLEADAPELRMAAANAIGRTEEPRTVPALVDHLDDPNPRVRARVARALGGIGEPAAVSHLVGRANDENPVVRREIAGALGNCGGPGALETLCGLARDSVESVRRAAVEGLGESGRAEALPTLAGAFDDRNDVVCRTAALAVIDLLTNAPTDRSDDLRQAVVNRLGSVDERAVVGPLVEVLEDGQRPEHRRNAAWLLGRLPVDTREGRVVEALCGALDDDDRIVSRFAATSLQEFGGSVVERQLIDILDDDTASSRAAAMAVFALGSVGGDLARERIARLTDRTDDQQVRKRAFAALSSLGGR